MKAKTVAKLKQLPNESGVYLFRDKAGQVIYIGKASILKRRVASYFQKTTDRDFKTDLLVKLTADVDWVTTNSEVEALFLESEYIKRYKPIYNVQKKDDKSFIYVKITTQDDFPIVSFVRRPLGDKATYFGPFVAIMAIRKAMRHLRKIFPYITSSQWPKVSPLEHQIGLAPPPNILKADYRKNINRLLMVMRGQHLKLLHDLEKDMAKAATAKRYEEAASLRNQLVALKALSQKMIFGSEETFDLNLDAALSGLADLLGLTNVPRTIEAYDISNFAGGDAVASMIVFVDGLPNQSRYRRFKMRSLGPNDFAMMREVIRRRFLKQADWPLPDLVLIDGGKGQLSAALKSMIEINVKVAAIGLAKRYEQIVQKIDPECINNVNQVPGIHETPSGQYRLINLPPNSPIIQLLQRIRDEAHRFAVSYHTDIRDKRVRASVLDSIPGVGPATRKKLVRAFGSVQGVRQASDQELLAVVGKKYKTIKEYL